MMFYASQGLRSVGRKVSNALSHHRGGHNGPGGGATANSTSRSVHHLHPTRAPHVASVAPPSLAQIRPRSPANEIFYASRNALQFVFSRLGAPGFRVPNFLSDVAAGASRSLNTSAIHRTRIQDGLSLPVRNAIRNNHVYRQANTFLPRAPRVPPRCGGVAQVGLGAARNFSSGRPIFQHLAENVPIAARALYEADWDLKAKKDAERVKFMNLRIKKEKTKRTRQMMRPLNKTQRLAAEPSAREIEKEIERYFHAEKIAPVTTYLLVPLAPTPSGRVPLSADNAPALLPPLQFLGLTHQAHSNHAIRVSSLFTRLDQGNVWARGVTCSAYSQGQIGRMPRNLVKDDETDYEEEGVCTVLKVEFAGWTKAEVRSVIGESGTGWCVLEEIRHDEDTDDTFSDTSSMSGQSYGDASLESSLMSGEIDPSQSFVLPTLDFSAQFMTSAPSPPFSRHSSVADVWDTFSELDEHPWDDVHSDVNPYGSSLSARSSYSDLSETQYPGFSADFETRRWAGRTQSPLEEVF